MPREIRIASIDPTDERLEGLAAEARAEGYEFVDRLVREARSGVNRFDQPGEIFCGAFAANGLVGCGGVNLDPYLTQRVGRLRHVFVSGAARRTGVATVLVEALVRRSRSNFSLIRLRTPDARANRFYEAIGFVPTTEDMATHIFRL